MLYPIKMYETLCARQGLVQTDCKSRFTRHEVLQHWGIGKLLFERKLESRYGEGIVRRLSGDLKEHFPQMGLSTRQLWNMKAFYIRYKDCDEKVLRSVAVLPWSQNLIILSKNLTDEQTIFYATESIHKGWNRDLLLNAIKMQMHVGGTVREF